MALQHCRVFFWAKNILPNMNKLITFLTFFLLLIGSTGSVWADYQASVSSAKLNATITIAVPDERVATLKGYLEQYNSPLAPYAADFVKYADMYDIDYRLLPAISGVESTFGKQIPYGSYNGWGWGIYGKESLGFASWTDAIATISRGIREGYLRDNPDTNPFVIGPTYAASPTWAVRVDYFMRRIEDYRIKNSKPQLSLAL